jgi:hypothetical protein
MTTVGNRDQGVDSGYLAVSGHRLLGSAAVVRGALDTLADEAHAVSPAQRALLEATVLHNLDVIVEIARSLVAGEQV